MAHLGKTASNVTFSQHKIPNESREEREKRESILPSNTKLQDDVKRFTPTGVEFIDGSHQTFDVVIHATGNIHVLRIILFPLKIIMFERMFFLPIFGTQLINWRGKLSSVDIWISKSTISSLKIVPIYL